MEAERYKDPIASRSFILQTLEEHKEPLTLDEIIKALSIRKKPQQEALSKRLNAMIRDGQLVLNRRGCYGLLGKMNLVKGRVLAHKDGFGFVVPEEGDKDIFMPPKEMRSLMHGDEVVVSIVQERNRGKRKQDSGRISGRLIEVLKRANQTIIGRFHHEHGMGFVVPDNTKIVQDVLVAKEYWGGAEDGQIVEVEIIKHPDRRHPPKGKVIAVLGDYLDAGMEIQMALRSFDVPFEWPATVEAEMQTIPDTVPEEAKQDREDLRALPLVTIDGADARDFDDAVYCEKQGKGWRLLVAIADVASYVKPNSALDQEAVKRGTSVYFPDYVVPMLPEKLSNGLCSLNPDVDRLCLVCEMQINAHGEVKKHRFSRAIMRSHARLTYEQAFQMLQDQSANKTVMPVLNDLSDLYEALHQARQKRGALDFDRVESRIIFDDNRKVEKIISVERLKTHRMIEECMIAANITAALYLGEQKMPFLYRVHEAPKPEKIEALQDFLKGVGLTLSGGDDPQPKDFAKCLKTIESRTDAHMIETVLLRSLNQAVYTPKNEGHFGLALTDYAHFTSPIRRYPDLLVHRALHHLLTGGDNKNYDQSDKSMVSFGQHCSMAERRADEATRDVVDWLKCHYMQERVGDSFAGVVTGVTDFGLFVELTDVYVEGLVHITTLPKDYYTFDAARHALVGDSKGLSFQLSQEVEVTVLRVDLDSRKIDLGLADK